VVRALPLAHADPREAGEGIQRRFLLAKLNTDESPQVAAALRVRSIRR